MTTIKEEEEDRKKRSKELSKEINKKLLERFGSEEKIKKYFNFKKVEIELIKE